MQKEHLTESIKEARKAIGNTTDLFYQQKSAEGFQGLNQTINLLMLAVDELTRFQTENNLKLVEDQILNKALSEAMQAIERKDTILLADILVFEIDEILKDSLERI